MKLKNLNVRLIKLPPKIEVTLYLIREELKSAKFFDGLSRVGVDDVYYQSHHGLLILSYMGFDTIPDDLSNFYTGLIDKYCEKIEEDKDVIMKCAFEVYVEMMIEKRKRMHDPKSDKG
jgi:hypothetical protein